MKAEFDILLIESNWELANQIEKWLDNKANFVHAHNDEMIDSLIKQSHWHLVIINANDNESVNSIKIIDKVKQADPNTSVLIIAENIKIDYILNAMSLHADDLMFKPLDQNKFLDKVWSLASGAKKKKTKKIILAIGAHPDDVEYGCGATLVRMRAEGCKINIATLSLGDVGGEPSLRKKEAENAAEFLNADLYLGDFADTKINNSRETIQFLEQIIWEIKPTHVYTHSYFDNHQDHRNIHQATITAARQVANVFTYFSPSSTTEFRPNMFVNIDDFIDDKLKLIGLFESQSSNRPYLDKDQIRATALYWGRFANYKLVEPLEVIKGSY